MPEHTELFFSNEKIIGSDDKDVGVNEEQHSG